MTNNNLDSERLKLANDGVNSNLDKVLNDIIRCSVRNVVREMSIDDIIKLSGYMRFPTKRDNQIIIGSARQEIMLFLMNHPAFRSENSAVVRDTIIYYYQTHPNEINPTPKPAWIAAFQNQIQKQ